MGSTDHIGMDPHEQGEHAFNANTEKALLLCAITTKPWNKPAGTRGNLHFKIAPGSQGFVMNQGKFQMNQGQFSKYSLILPEHNKVLSTRKRPNFFDYLLRKEVK